MLVVRIVAVNVVEWNAAALLAVAGRPRGTAEAAGTVVEAGVRLWLDKDGKQSVDLNAFG